MSPHIMSLVDFTFQFQRLYHSLWQCQPKIAKKYLMFPADWMIWAHWKQYHLHIGWFHFLTSCLSKNGFLLVNFWWSGGVVLDLDSYVVELSFFRRHDCTVGDLQVCVSNAWRNKREQVKFFLKGWRSWHIQSFFTLGFSPWLHLHPEALLTVCVGQLKMTVRHCSRLSVLCMCCLH